MVLKPEVSAAKRSVPKESKLWNRTLYSIKLPLPNVSANTTESSSQCLYFRHERSAQPGQWQGWEVKDKNAAIFIIASAALQSALYLLHSHHLDIIISGFKTHIYINFRRSLFLVFTTETFLHFVLKYLTSWDPLQPSHQRANCFSQKFSFLILMIVVNRKCSWNLKFEIFYNPHSSSPPFDAKLAPGPHAGCDSCWS